MNCRSVLTMIAIGAIGFCASSIAKADEVLKFRMFTHATSVQPQEVGDVDGHVLGVGHFSGLVLLSDGSVGTGTLTAMFDYIKGAGIFHAYYGVTPSKGSTLWVKVSPQTAKPVGETTVFSEAPAIVVGGSGRFEGAKGDGTYVGGVRLTALATGAEAWAEFVINVKK